MLILRSYSHERNILDESDIILLNCFVTLIASNAPQLLL